MQRCTNSGAADRPDRLQLIDVQLIDVQLIQAKKTRRAAGLVRAQRAQLQHQCNGCAERDAENKRDRPVDRSAD